MPIRSDANDSFDHFYDDEKDNRNGISGQSTVDENEEFDPDEYFNSTDYYEPGEWDDGGEVFYADDDW